MATSKQRDRSTLTAGLAERGYNAALMFNDQWDREGYYLMVTDSKGKPLVDEDGYIHRVWQYWDSEADYRFVRDWFEGKIV
jgi:hypothetical protein